MGKAKFYIFTYQSLDYLIKLIFVFFSSAIVYLMFNDRLILKFIPIDTTGTHQVGKITRVKGEVMRKIVTDSLYLPIFKGTNLYQDDLIVTGEGSTADLEIEPNNYITTEPNSAIRLRIIGKHIFIQFHKGDIVTHFTSDKILEFQQGVLNTQVQIRKGTFLIKNSNAGIQITAYTSRHQIKKSNIDKEEKKVEVKLVDKTDDKTETDPELERKRLAEEQREELLRLERERMEERRLASPFQLPYPPENTAFLLKGGHTINVVIKGECLGSCNLKIFRDKKLIIEKIYKLHETPSYDFNVDENNLGLYEWVYLDNEDNLRGLFTVAAFSEDSFNKAMLSEYPIEIY